MASPGLGLLVAFGLPLLPARWGPAWGQSRYPRGAGLRSADYLGPGEVENWGAVMGYFERSLQGRSG